MQSAWEQKEKTLHAYSHLLSQPVCQYVTAWPVELTQTELTHWNVFMSYFSLFSPLNVSQLYFTLILICMVYMYVNARVYLRTCICKITTNINRRKIAYVYFVAIHICMCACEDVYEHAIYCVCVMLLCYVMSPLLLATRHMQLTHNSYITQF